MSYERREGEVTASRDPALEPGDASVVFIGRIRSPWHTREQCPKNMRQALEVQSGGCWLEIDEPWRDGLEGLAQGDHVHLLYWMHEARRDLIRQKPRHRDTATGTFALRSPVRPNPIALALVQITALDVEMGRIDINATDALDNTPLLDIKPHLPSIDIAVGTSMA